ncbi:CBM35 domain-containing protein [Dactylosporangium sp. CA-152071]|uniref:CBM35 domain-containing protein n=1 Tax=Dactylosporangium sp. CA-152071 TaxID=3239933 RepID=UPI003D9057D7
MRPHISIVLAAALVLPTVAVAGPPASAATASTTYEAESGTLQGVTVADTVPGFSGTGYVAGFDDPADTVTITVPGGPGGLFDLSVRYRSPFGDKQTRLLLNGAPAGDLLLPGTETFAEVGDFKHHACPHHARP